MKTEREHFERIETIVLESAEAAAGLVAAEIGDLIEQRAREKRMAVLGLATGSTPIPVYGELIRLHREQGLSFRNVITFNLDEYYGLSDEDPESYHVYMRERLFRHVDIPVDQTRIPCGTVEGSRLLEYCNRYEQDIEEAGGIDYQILGIGRTGHIGFNEPGSVKDSRTRLVRLSSLTRSDAGGDFGGEANVPWCAITMGVGTILRARRIVLMAWGRAKAAVVRRAVMKLPNSQLPASFLQGHPDVRFFLDGEAAEQLGRVCE